MAPAWACSAMSSSARSPGSTASGACASATPRRHLRSVPRTCRLLDHPPPRPAAFDRALKWHGPPLAAVPSSCHQRAGLVQLRHLARADDREDDEVADADLLGRGHGDPTAGPAGHSGRVVHRTLPDRPHSERGHGPAAAVHVRAAQCTTAPLPARMPRGRALQVPSGSSASSGLHSQAASGTRL